jgi:hypothetical protein
MLNVEVLTPVHYSKFFVQYSLCTSDSLSILIYNGHQLQVQGLSVIFDFQMLFESFCIHFQCVKNNIRQIAKMRLLINIVLFD